MVPNKRDAVAIGLQHGAPGDGVEFDIIAWVDPGTRARAGARVFGAHCFNGHIFLHCYRADYPHMAAATAMH